MFWIKKKEHNNNHNNNNDSNNNTSTYLKPTLEACDSVKYKTAVTAAIKISGVKTEWSQRSKVKITPPSCWRRTCQLFSAIRQLACCAVSISRARGFFCVCLTHWQISGYTPAPTHVWHGKSDAGVNSSHVLGWWGAGSDALRTNQLWLWKGSDKVQLV